MTKPRSTGDLQVNEVIGQNPPRIVPKVSRRHSSPLSNQPLSATDLRDITTKGYAAPLSFLPTITLTNSLSVEQKLRSILIISAAVSILGCAAKPVLPAAQGIEIVTETPDRSKCKLLGEVTGSQGNWFTGDFTSNKNLAIGARNEIRNEAHMLGGNLVHIQDMKNTNAWGSLGTSNTTAIGKVYRCQ